MTLKARITEDMKNAMRAREATRLSTIRMLLAAMKQREVDERIELADADVVAIIDKMIKQRRESIVQFDAGNRPDLAAVERAEITLLQAYMPQPLSETEIDALIASTGGAAGSGSTGSSAMDAYDLHTGNGNNLSGYSNGRIDGIIAAMAVTSDPKELARLLGEGGTILWGDMPTLPLYRQQRTLLTSKKTYAVSSNPTRWGAGWNMDRWVLAR